MVKNLPLLKLGLKNADKRLSALREGEVIGKKYKGDDNDMFYDDDEIFDDEDTSKKMEAVENIEEIIKENLHSLEDGIQIASEGAYLEGCPLYVVYYDRKNKGCLMLDLYRLSDWRDEYDDVIEQFVMDDNSGRFVKVSYEIATHDYDLMEEFAYMKRKQSLISALQGDRPMRTFNYRVAKLGLDREWDAFRFEAYDKGFEDWKKANKI